MIDRKIYRLHFSGENLHHWKCPTCNIATLKLKKDSFNSFLTATSKREQSEDYWDPSMADLRYSCVLECTNASCQEQVISLGNGIVQDDFSYDHEGNAELNWLELFTPEYFSPHLKIFDVSSKAPLDVAQEINHSFKLFFSSPASSVNRVRTALEFLLNHLNVKKYKTITTKKGIKKEFY